MMGTTTGAVYLWIALWTVLGVAVAVTCGVVAARMLGDRHQPHGNQVGATESPGRSDARDALRVRYARGEISREDYLQGKVELED